MTPEDSRHMAHALAMGRRHMGQTWPRPSVGCVIVKNGRVIARGVTDSTAHAEANALSQAGAAARGATAYVTLEPCAHQGRTPPCAEALVRAGVTRVVTALQDPDPRVSGQGHAILRRAGIEVTENVLSDAARRDHAGFLMRVTRSRPFVTLKLALSVDGRIATATGESQWITGPDARRFVHGQRSLHDAVMVGAGTARADDPSLTVRGLGDVTQPVRVVVSRSLDIPTTGSLAQTARQIPLWLVHGEDANKDRVQTWKALGAVMYPCSVQAGRVEPGAALGAMAAAGLTRVFCEGGGQLAASLLAADLVDELQIFTAGLTLGAEGYPGIGAMGVEKLALAPRFQLRAVQKVGADILHLWQRANS